MTRKLTLKAALASTAAMFALAPTASAQQGYYGGYDELYLFDHERYYGQSVILDGPVAAIYDFNDRAESADLSGYGWLLCKHADFEGPCVVMREPIDDLGDYGLDDEISSARPLSPENPYPHGTIFGQNYYGDIVFYEMGSWGLVEMDPYDAWGYGYGDGYRTGVYGDYGRYGLYDPYNPYYDYDPNDWDGYRGPRNADVVLYRHAGYRGSAYGLNQDAWNLSTLHFNDEVSSIEIRRGTWEICEHANFQGRCYTVDASVSALQLNDAISSIRRIDGHRGRRHGENQNYGHGGNRGDGNNHGNRDNHGGNRNGDRGDHGNRQGGHGSRNPDVVLYEHGNYQGRFVRIDSDIANLSTLGLNDAASSIRITSGTWEVCEHANYQGQCQIINASQAGILMNDRVSSLRRVNGNSAGRNQQNNNQRDRDNDRDRGQNQNRDRDTNTGRDNRNNDRNTQTSNTERSHEDHPRWGNRPTITSPAIRSGPKPRPEAKSEVIRTGRTTPKPAPVSPLKQNPPKRITPKQISPKEEPSFVPQPRSTLPRPPKNMPVVRPEVKAPIKPTPKPAPRVMPRPAPKPAPKAETPPAPKPVVKPFQPRQDRPKPTVRNAEKYRQPK